MTPTPTTSTPSLQPRASDHAPSSELGTYEIVRRLPVTTWSLRPASTTPSIPLTRDHASAMHALGRLAGWLDAMPWIDTIAHRLGSRYTLPTPPPAVRVTTAWLGASTDARAGVASVPPPPAWLPSIIRGWQSATDLASVPPPLRAEAGLLSASWTLWLFASTQPYGASSSSLARAHAARMIAIAAALPLPLVAGVSRDGAHTAALTTLLANAHCAESYAAWHSAWLLSVASECESLQRTLRAFGRERERILALAGAMRAPIHCIALAHELAARPTLAVADASKQLQLTFRAAQAIVDKFVAEKLLREVTGRKRDRMYQCDALSDDVLFGSKHAVPASE